MEIVSDTGDANDDTIRDRIVVYDAVLVARNTVRWRSLRYYILQPVGSQPIVPTNRVWTIMVSLLEKLLYYKTRLCCYKYWNEHRHMHVSLNGQMVEEVSGVIQH